MSRPTRSELLEYYSNHFEVSPMQDAIDLANWALDQVAQKTEQVEGVLSFDEFDKMVDDHNTYSSRTLYDACHVGFVPAGNTIQIPLEKDWPQAATHFVAMFASDNFKDGLPYMIEELIKIPRSKPQWKPTDTDVVLFWDDHHDDDYIPQDAMLCRPVIDNWNHYAKVEELSDIGKNIGWLKANRKFL